METKQKVQYDAPALEVVEISSESTLCQGLSADGSRGGYGSAQEF